MEGHTGDPDIDWSQDGKAPNTAIYQSLWRLSSYTTIQLRHMMIRLRHKPRAQGIWNDKRGNLAALLRLGQVSSTKAEMGIKGMAMRRSLCRSSDNCQQLKRCYLWPQTSQHGHGNSRRSFDQIKEDMREAKIGRGKEQSSSRIPSPLVRIPLYHKGERCQSSR